MKKVVIILVIFFVILSICVILFFPNNKNMFNDNNVQTQVKIRPAAVAGQFYPADRDELLAQIKYSSDLASNIEKISNVKFLIVPHAGYVYSGKVMAAGFKAVAGKEFKRVVILGVSHNFWFDGVAAAEADVWQTSLGKVKIDQAFIEKLMADDNEIFRRTEYHAPEHCLEVEIPWLQYFLKSDFKIVPLLLGGDSQATQRKLAKTLSDLWDNETLLVISSDLSHYPPYEVAKIADNKILQSIAKARADDFYHTYADLEKEYSTQVETFACGRSAIAVGLYLAEEYSWRGKILAYANSGDVDLGDKQRVVGYGALAFYDNKEDKTASDFSPDLNKAEQKIALQYVRAVLNEHYFGQGDFPDLSLFPIFKEKRGVFVTLYKKQNKALRGCIGQIVPQGSLAENLKSMALAAALEDPRFSPVTADELNDLEIEISVLSPMKKVNSAEEIELGKHGVMVKQGSRTGVFLPQVAKETEWDLVEFMSHLCRDKAGIAPDAWQTGGVEIYIFTAQVFSE